MNEDLYKLVKDERKTSDEKYAVKLIEKIVFSALSVVGLAVLAKFLMTINL